MKAFNHVTRRYKGIVLERMEHLPPGGKMGDLPEHLQHESFIRTGAKKTGGPNMRLIRLMEDTPSLTVTAYIFNKFVHPTEDRYITPREAACLQDFPIDYRFMGTLGQIQKQIGNAVPVKLATALAMQIGRFIHSNYNKKDINIYSYFTGAGGLDLGFEAASNSSFKFNTIFSTDIEPWIEKTINVNRPEWNFYRTDIKDLKPKMIKDFTGQTPDMIIGGPPCQPFSVAGKQKALNDPLGVLYRDYILHIKELKPKFVLMENVYGLAQVKSANMVQEIYTAFNDIGYEVKHKELMSADYGTPQKRRRLFFVAAPTLKDFEFPLPTHAESVSNQNLLIYTGAGQSFSHLPKPIFLEESRDYLELS